MNQTFYQTIIAVIALLLGGISVSAQEKQTKEINIDNVKITVTENTDSTIKKKRKGLEGMQISIGNKGISIRDPKKKKKHKKLHTGMHFDFGINNVVDNTNYNGTMASSKLVTVDDISATAPNARALTSKDLALRNGKSINFNFWPVWLKQDVAKHNVQIETGLGFQFFNYRYSSNVIHQDGETGGIVASTPYREVTDPALLTGKEKNKFGVSYVSIPLMLRFNSNKKKGHRYFVGGGVIGSYKLKSWTKFYGNKHSGNFGVNDWMTQLTAELGVTGVIKLYGTYALQSMYSNGIDRRPFAIGIRL